MRCEAHGRRGFTLYPPGHVPYGRKAIAPVSLDGQSWRSGPERFCGTVFEAALDASRGAAWPRESGGAGDRYWPSMWRRLAEAEVWLGVSPGLDERRRERCAADLSVDLLPLREGARAIGAAPGYRSRGTAVVKVLGELPEGLPLLERLLRAGHAAGRLGEPLVPVHPGGPLRSLARERGGPAGPCGGRDPPRKRDVPSSGRGP